jgi:hypothetical protein
VRDQHVALEEPVGELDAARFGHGFEADEHAAATREEVLPVREGEAGAPGRPSRVG